MGVSSRVGRVSAVGHRLVSLLGPEEIPISISWFLPCLIVGCKLGDIMAMGQTDKVKEMKV